MPASRIEIGAMVTLGLALLGGVLAFGNLQGKLDAMSPDSIRKAQNDAIDRINAAANARVALNAIPVGTVISSVLPLEKFRETPGYVDGEWIEMRNQALPAGSAYEKLTKSSRAPDLSHLDQALILTSVVLQPVAHGKRAIVPAGVLGEWLWIASLRDVQGRAYNNDNEQDLDQFQVLVDENGSVVSQGRTYNRKFSRWGEWNPGSATVFGLSTVKQSLHHYLKIN